MKLKTTSERFHNLTRANAEGMSTISINGLAGIVCLLAPSIRTSGRHTWSQRQGDEAIMASIRLGSRGSLYQVRCFGDPGANHLKQLVIEAILLTSLDPGSGQNLLPHCTPSVYRRAGQFLSVSYHAYHAYHNC